MDAFILEIKAKVTSLDTFHKYLKKNKAKFCGLDHQVDTYFDVVDGRLKLRQGSIENTLIYYHRKEAKGTKESKVLFQVLGQENDGLLDILTKLHGVKKVVDKKRSIYYIDNVKFHLDEVQSLGFFIEIEAISENGAYDSEYLQRQLDYYIKEWNLDSADMVDCSYCDLL